MNSRILFLTEKVNLARRQYHNDRAQVSDKIYDAWVDELAELDPKNPAVIGIGAEPVSNWEKYTHKTILGSLNKCQTREEFQVWYDKYINTNDEVLLTLKLDGLSVSLIYENGILVNGSTRGSGSIGEKITQNVAKMQGVPLRLKQKINATIRGEILLSKENHKKYFSEYSNTRNSASGISRRYDGEGCDKLAILTYQLMIDDYTFDTQAQQFATLQKLGFIVPPYFVVNTAENAYKLRDEYNNSLRDKFEFDLDGLVCHNNNMAKQTEYGSLHGRPYGSLAMKFDSVAREGCISDIQIQVGSMGRLTPVAIFNPKILLMGAEVERATLHNFANIEELGAGVGATVLVCRSNDVIPFIEEVISPPKEIFKRPIHCPECDTKVIEQGEYIQCPNENCPAQIIGRIANWIKELNILEFGTAIIQKLIESGKVATIADLYKLTVEDLASMERMGEKSAQNCYDSLWKHKEIPLELCLGGLSIPMIGSSTIKLLMGAGYDTLDKIMMMTQDQMENIKGLGPTRSTSLYNGLKKNKELIGEIMKSIKVEEKIVGKLSGKSFAITGTLSMKRADIENLIIENGGEVKKQVGKNCGYLIIADTSSQTSKAVNARELGTTLISEENLISMIE